MMAMGLLPVHSLGDTNFSFPFLWLSDYNLVLLYSSNDWKRLSEFAVNKHLVSPIDVSALAVACKIPAKIPNAFQSKRLLDLLERAIDEGFKI